MIQGGYVDQPVQKALDDLWVYDIRKNDHVIDLIDL